MKKCPYCAEDIQDEDIKCQFCNRDLKEIETPTSIETTTPTEISTPTETPAPIETQPSEQPTKSSKAFFWGILIGIIFLIIGGVIWSKIPKGPTLITCQTCDGSGHISKTMNKEMPYAVTNVQYVNKGSKNPDFYAHVSVTNQGNEGGVFAVEVTWYYSDIGNHVERDQSFIEKGTSKEFVLHYDADKEADRVGYVVFPAIVFKTETVVCPTCNGTGKVQKQ